MLVVGVSLGFGKEQIMGLPTSRSAVHAPASLRRRARWHDHVVAKLLVVVAATGLAVALFLYAGQQEPLPAWITLPPDSTIQVSRHRPATGDAGGLEAGPAYFLQVRCKGDPQTAAEQVMGCVSGYSWSGAETRQVTMTDVVRRGQWPGWIREHLERSKDIQSGYTATGSSSSGKLYVFAWPAEEGAVVEVVEEVDWSSAAGW